MQSHISGEFNISENSGMFELEKQSKCLDPSHNFPTLLCIPQGQGYKHVCPRCGNVQIATNPIIY